MKKKFNAFTLVELMIVMVILVVLTTVWFISYEKYVSDSRDSKRLALLKELRDSLRVYGVQYWLPLPDDSIELRDNGKIFAYQWYAGKEVLSVLNLDETLYDPKDEVYFTYYVNQNRDEFQLMAFLEKQPLESFLFKNEIHAASYTKRFPVTFGQPMGILISQQTNIPLQELDEFKAPWFIDFWTNTWSTQLIVLSEPWKYISWTPWNLIWLTPLSTCNTIYKSDPIKYSKNGTYTINPTWDKPLLVYCDMDENNLWHGGWWTFTTFIWKTWIWRWAWEGTADAPYRYDRSGLWSSYGLDLKKIPHTEAYAVIKTPDLTQEKIDTKEVANFKNDYKNPIFDPSIGFRAKPTSALRWWFDGEFMLNHVHGGYNNNYDGYIALYKEWCCVHQWIRMKWGLWMQFPNEASRQDNLYYDTSIHTYPQAPYEKAWYYVR